MKQIDVAYPNDRNCPQIGDTFAMLANAALESIIKRLRHTTQELLLAHQVAAPNAYPRLWSQLDKVALFGNSDEKTECYLSSDQWRQRLLLTVDAILDCLTPLSQTAPAPSRGQVVSPAVNLWVGRLEKIINDELRLERDENGRLIHVSFLSKKKRGKYRICSATDPEATIRNHGPGKNDFGYNISVTASTDFIHEIQADTGSRPDAAAIPDLLHAQIEHHARCPDKFIYDQAAGWGKTAFLVDQATEGRTQLVAKPVPLKKRWGDFRQRRLSSVKMDLPSPVPMGAHLAVNIAPAVVSGDGHNFRFIAAQCLLCLLLKSCRGNDKTPTTARHVFISSYRAERNQLATYSKTDDFKLDMSLRLQIERGIAGLVLHNGTRRAHFRGLKKVDFQVKMCTTAYNLKRWVSLLNGKRHKKRRRFGAPMPASRPFMEEVGLVTT